MALETIELAMTFDEYKELTAYLVETGQEGEKVPGVVEEILSWDPTEAALDCS